MEDLYSDLENYQYENNVTELKNENEALKCKLEEYASTLASLQKDFDKLSAEYKKLELNYSSLLKTARAEIERKSQLITNLNIEKDRLVIESIQKRGRKPYRNTRAIGNKQHTIKQSALEGDSTKQENVTPIFDSENVHVSGTLNYERKERHDKKTPTPFTNVKDNLNGKDLEQKSQRKEKNLGKNQNETEKIKENKLDVVINTAVTSNDKTTIGCTLKTNPDVTEREPNIKEFKFYRDRDQSIIEVKKSKENHSDVLSGFEVASKNSRVVSRRKSMPLVNRGDVNFSSDEEQNEGSKDHRFRRKTPLNDDGIQIDRIHLDRYRDYHGRNKPERMEAEHIRVGDKHASNYDSRDVYRRSNNWYRDSDRHSNRYHRSKYESHQRYKRYYSPERPYNIQGEYLSKHRESYDRPHRIDNGRSRTLVSPPPEKHYQHRSREFDGLRFQHEGVYPIKHKIHDIIDEPACKRFRSESLNKPSDNHMTVQDRDVEGRARSLSRPLELSYLSLQSPDYVNLENHPPIHQIKEIRGTSDIKLDDPRLKSKKYMVNTQGDKVVISTVVGRDVDIKPIYFTMWNKNNDKHIPEMPTALKEKPSTSEDLIKDIYMGIDNSLLNPSLESGEICLDEEMVTVGENKGLVTLNPEDSNYEGVDSNMQNHCVIEESKSEPIDKIDNVQQKCPMLLSKNCRIPKIKKSDACKVMEDSNYNTCNKLNKRESSKQGHKKKNDKERKHKDKKLQLDCKDYKSSKMDKKHKSVEENFRKHYPEKVTISARDTVAGDLELSDETCDYIDAPDQTQYEKENKDQKVEECTSNIVIENIKKDSNVGKAENSHCINKESAVFKHEIGTVYGHKHFNLSDKNHEIEPKKSSSKTYIEQKSKDIKSKLCDLFGDTSSLITLDDLGIAPPTTTKENLNEYAPLFDNTQDALDLNFEEMAKVQTRSLNIKTDEDDPFKDRNHSVTSEKSENNKDKNATERENQKFNNNKEKNSPIQHIFENVNTDPEDNTVVKTVIISTGIQSNCLSGGTVHDEGQENLKTTIQNTITHNEPSCPALLSIKALATSTPYKPQNELSSSVPEISCKSNNSTNAKDASNIDIQSNTENVSKENKIDIPDVRIIVKRRRKIKGAPT